MPSLQPARLVAGPLGAESPAPGGGSRSYHRRSGGCAGTGAAPAAAPFISRGSAGSLP